MAGWKRFEDFWNTSGILETDDFYELSKEFSFDKDNVPEALRGLIKTVWALSGMDGYNAGKNVGKEECDESWKTLIDTATIILKHGDKKAVDSVINLLMNK